MSSCFRAVLLSLLLLGSMPSLAADKLIALTFDDGPRPYVLFGTPSPQPSPGLLDVLDRHQVKGTFFVMGWRLTPKTWGEPRHEKNIGITCIEAAGQLLKRGHEIENHTYSHIELRQAERRKGEAWVLADVNRGADTIHAVTGSRPKFLRPPDWGLTDNARRDIERHGHRVLTISTQNPVAIRDINSLDYLCAGARPVQCPKPSMASSVLKQIEQREKKGVYAHILAFHELTSTTTALPQVITELKARGYRFVRLDEYMKTVSPK